MPQASGPAIVLVLLLGASACAMIASWALHEPAPRYERAVAADAGPVAGALPASAPPPSLSSPPPAALTEPDVGLVPPELGLPKYYERYVDAGGIPVVGTGGVPNEALLRARTTLLTMLAKRPDVRDAMIACKVRLVVMRRNDDPSRLPENARIDPLWKDHVGRHLSELRGHGASPQNPICVCPAENLLGEPGDWHRGEHVTVHEIAHSMDLCGLRRLPGIRFGERVDAAYEAAIAAGLWRRTYAGTNAREYWAVGVSAWFGSHLDVPEPDGDRNHVNTRAELRAYDPTLAALIAEVFPDDVDIPAVSPRRR